ncbi:UU173 family protein [Metamycoplasma neophronis]|uniref:DUF2779 domain-containing protein n=1 Tax=Metamycoplasma neophronis TaxID=872983 RepID=A0ABY2YZF4_9BACT|nr:DUF2779 domain-containing protein [Metamycoplasma neophronis]TPR53198.1 DUF2779 domain-containing protein [Metamycoplasma neophronis]
MNNKNKYYNFKQFLLLNSARPFFAFHDINMLALENDEDEENENDKNPYDLLEFEFEEIDEKITKNFIEYIPNNVQSAFLQSSPIEKLTYLEKTVSNSNELFLELNKANKLSVYNDLLSNFAKFEAMNSGMSLVTEAAQNAVIEHYQTNFPEIAKSIKVITDKCATETKLEITKAEIEANHRLLINPAFAYRNCISRPFFYCPEQKTIGILNYSSKSSLKNIIRAYYDVNVMRALGYEIEIVKLIIPALLKRDNIKKGKLPFIFSDYANTSKSKAKVDDSFSQLENQARVNKDPNFDYTSNRTKKSNEKNLSIIEHVNSELADIFPFSFSIEDEKSKKARDFICSFTRFVEMVNNQEKYPEINHLELVIQESDLKDPVGHNLKPYTYLVEKLLPDYQIAAKSLLTLKINSIWNNSFASEAKYGEILDFYEKNLISIDPKIENSLEYSALSQENKKVVWFDFEGVTLPIPIIDFCPAWNQVIAQTSIIKTYNNSILENESFDYVYDPQGYDFKTLIKIIEDLYDDKADYYVVFNAGYEKARINELKKMLQLNYQYYKNIDIEKLKEIEAKIDFILDKIIDIAKPFQSTKVDICLRLINIGQIKARYSIKKIEHFVTENNLPLKRKIFPYHELQVKNGGMALQIATSRALGLIRNYEWEDKVKELKRYCHNDVLAMIMVWDLVTYLMQDKEKYFEVFKKYR